MHGNIFDIFMRRAKSFIIKCMRVSLSQQNHLMVMTMWGQ